MCSTQVIYVLCLSDRIRSEIVQMQPPQVACEATDGSHYLWRHAAVFNNIYVAFGHLFNNERGNLRLMQMDQYGAWNRLQGVRTGLLATQSAVQQGLFWRGWSRVFPTTEGIPYDMPYSLSPGGNLWPGPMVADAMPALSAQSWNEHYGGPAGGTGHY